MYTSIQGLEMMDCKQDQMVWTGWIIIIIIIIIESPLDVGGVPVGQGGA